MFQDYPSNVPRICLSYGIDKAILNRLQEEVTSEQFEQIVLESYAIIYPLDTVNELKPRLIARVYARITELQKPTEPASKKRQTKSFGTALAEWMGNLSAAESCLYLADFDVGKALKYYWEEDYLLVQEAIKLKSTLHSQNSLIQLEASMYGFGGRYSDDTQAEDKNTINLDDMDPSDIQGMLGGFGF